MRHIDVPNALGATALTAPKACISTLSPKPQESGAARLQVGKGELPGEDAVQLASSLGNGTLTIDPELRERVFNHRAEVIQADQQIKYLQDYAHTCAKGGAL